MFDSLITFVKENIVLFDIIFLSFVIYFSFQCFVKGFFKPHIFFKMDISTYYNYNFSSKFRTIHYRLF